MKNAKPSPQIRPAPGLVALFEKNNPKISPNSDAKIRLSGVHEASIALHSNPPAKPTRSPSKESIQTGDNVFFVVRGPGAIAVVSWFISSLISWFGAGILFQIDGLNDVTRKEKFHRPIHQDANLPLQSRQFCEIDPSPHGPCQQA